MKATTIPKTIAVDFDGTLCYSKWPELGEPNKPLIQYLKAWRNQGNKLILWTCRAGEALDRLARMPSDDSSVPTLQCR